MQGFALQVFGIKVEYESNRPKLRAIRDRPPLLQTFHAVHETGFLLQKTLALLPGSLNAFLIKTFDFDGRIALKFHVSGQTIDYNSKCASVDAAAGYVINRYVTLTAGVKCTAHDLHAALIRLNSQGYFP